jgi:anti-sigma-K factor RskA
VSADERDDLLFLYAAGALEGDERDEVEAWLARGDPAVRAELARAEEEVAQLAVGLRPVAPSALVRARLMRRVTAEAPGERPPLASGVTAGGRRRRAQPLRPVLAAGLAALLAAGLAAWVTRRAADQEATRHAEQLEDRLDAAGREIAALRNRLDAASAAQKDLDDELEEQEASDRNLQGELVLARKAISLLSSEKMESLALRGTPARPGAHARVFWDWKDWYCYLHAEGLEVDASHVYALWLFTERGEVVSVGTFSARSDGQATLIAPVPHDLGRVLRAGVSVEPDADLGPEPRGPVVLMGKAAS